MKSMGSNLDIDTVVRDFQRDGCVVLRNLIDPDILLKWRENFLPLLNQFLGNFADPSFRGANRHYITLPFRAPFSDPSVFDNDFIFNLMERLVGKDFTMVQLATDTPMKGSDYQELHADTPPLFPEINLATPSYQLAFNFPLCDVTLQNGPTEITRGTHTMPKDDALKRIAAGEIPVEAIEMKLGDAMIRDVRHIHRGTPNHTDEPRPMVVVGYSRKWLYRPEVSIQIPKQEWETLSPRSRHMLRFNPLVDSRPEGLVGETYKDFAY